MTKTWENVPVYYKCLDISALLQEAAIDDVVMEEADKMILRHEDSEPIKNINKEDEEDEELPEVIFFKGY